MHGHTRLDEGEGDLSRHGDPVALEKGGDSVLREGARNGLLERCVVAHLHKKETSYVPMTTWLERREAGGDLVRRSAQKHTSLVKMRGGGRRKERGDLVRRNAQKAPPSFK